jgi:hypothetical protein
MVLLLHPVACSRPRPTDHGATSHHCPMQGASSNVITISASQSQPVCACRRPFSLGDVVVRCATLHCPLYHHLACCGCQRPEHVPAHWRCPECRLRQMVCLWGSVQNVLARGVLASPDFTAELQWDLSPVDPLFSASAAQEVQLVCMPADGREENLCLWPLTAGLLLNGQRIAAPRPSPPSRSAPLLKATAAFLRVGRNTLTVQHTLATAAAAAAAAAAQGRPPAAAYACLAVVVTKHDLSSLPFQIASITKQVILYRCLNPGLAQMADVQAPLDGAPAQGYNGSLVSLRPSWPPPPPPQRQPAVQGHGGHWQQQQQQQCCPSPHWQLSA